MGDWGFDGVIGGLPGVFELGFLHDCFAVGGEVLGGAGIVGIEEGDVYVALGKAGYFVDLIDEMQKTLLEIPY